MIYDTVFWGISTNSNKVILLEKKIIRIMASIQRSELCGDLFIRFCILPLVSKYILASIAVTIDKYKICQPHSKVNKISTRHKCELHRLTAYLIM
jgi:hypothetical protein